MFQAPVADPAVAFETWKQNVHLGRLESSGQVGRSLNRPGRVSYLNDQKINHSGVCDVGILHKHFSDLIPALFHRDV